MKHKLLLATAVAAALFFISCKKDNPSNPNNPGGVTKKLKKVTRTDGGIVTVFNLTYNAANKLVSYRSTNNNEYVEFTYDAAGNLSKIEQMDNEFKNIYNYVFANNKPVSATFKSWELTAGEPDDLIEDDKITYTVENNRVTKMKLEMLQDDSEVDLELTYNNDNLTKVETIGVALYKAEFTYGNKKAALPKVTNWVLDQAGFSLIFGSKNEMTKAVYDFPGVTADKTINTTYTYDNNGYVLTSNDGIEQMVFEYE